MIPKVEPAFGKDHALVKVELADYRAKLSR